MLNKTQIVFKKENDFSFRTGSIFHGALMQIVDTEFADKMHRDNIRPYSQNVTFTDDRIIWNINTLTEEAKINISDLLMSDSFQSLYLSHKDISLDVCDKKIISQTSYDNMFKRIYIDSQFDNYGTYRFYTPTAFKSNGRYINMPDVRLIFNSIISKYNACAISTEFSDDNLIEEIENCVNITSFNLHSSYYSLEGVKIPSFVGEITLTSYKNERMKKFISMMLEFATYSGIGIKTALGMGAVRKINKE